MYTIKMKLSIMSVDVLQTLLVIFQNFMVSFAVCENSEIIQEIGKSKMTDKSKSIRHIEYYGTHKHYIGDCVTDWRKIENSW